MVYYHTKLRNWIDPQKLNYDALSRNPNPAIIPLIIANLNKVNWDRLSLNPYAIPILIENLDKINWSLFSMNVNAIPILINNFGKINWYIVFVSVC